MNISSNAVSADQNICVGVITSVNGVKGYVKIRTFTENSRDICSFKNLFEKESTKAFNLKLVMSKKDYIVAAIEGVTSREEAEKLRNTMLYISRDELPSLKEKEFYHSDLIGMEVTNTDSILLGTVRNVLNFGAGDILELQDPVSEKTIYYPFNNQFVKSIDSENNVITVDALEEVIASED